MTMTMTKKQDTKSVLKRYLSILRYDESAVDDWQVQERATLQNEWQNENAVSWLCSGTHSTWMGPGRFGLWITAGWVIQSIQGCKTSRAKPLFSGWK